MSIVLTLLLIILIVTLISQFGGKLNAKSSLVWWLIFAFLVFCTVYPEGLAPIAHLLGVQLVSNLVMASLIVFLMFLAIQESALNTSLARRFRDLVTTQAAREFSEKLLKEPVSKTQDQKKVLVVFPTFNEQSSLPSMISQLKKTDFNGDYHFYFCFVSDGSVDESEAILESNLATQYVCHNANVGVAGAMLTGFKILKRNHFDFVVQCDADGQHPVDQIQKLVAEADRSHSDLLIGSRYLKSGTFEKHESSTFTRKLGSVMIAGALRLFSNRFRVSDPTSGFRVYSKSAALFLLKQMPDDYPEPESLALLMLADKKISEVAVDMRPRQGGVSSLSGVKSLQFMVKVLTALIGLRLRSFKPG